MKKILFLIAIALTMSAASFSQTLSNPTLISQYGNAIDTVTNTGVNYLTQPATSLVRAYFKTILIVFKADKISGTLGGTAIPQISSNGVDFADMPGTSAYTLTDVATQTTAWKVTDWPGYKFRVKVAGTGTMSGKIYASAILKN